METASKLDKTRDRICTLAKILNEAYINDRELVMKEILYKLEDKGIIADRRTIYADIKALEQILECKISDRGSRKYKIVKQGKLTDEEVQMIKEALVSARFLSAKATTDLINIFYRSMQYKRKKGTLNDIRVEGRIKFGNENIRDNMKMINKKKKKRKKIRFDYWKYNDNLEPSVYRKECIVSPYAVVWYEDFYYLLGNYKDKIISYYRVDRIRNIEITKETVFDLRCITKTIDQINVADILSKQVGMSSGEEIALTIKFKKEHIGKLKDKFGDRMKIRNIDNEYVEANLRVINNKELISWMLRFGDGIEVLYPEDVRDQVREMVKNMNSIYDN